MHNPLKESPHPNDKLACRRALRATFSRQRGRRAVLFIAAWLLVLVSLGAASAAEIRVMVSGGLSAALDKLAPEFQRRTGDVVVAIHGPSMGTTENAIPQRLARGEPVDVLIMVGDALSHRVDHSDATAVSRVDLVRSPIGVAVRAGALRPDISTSQALKQALLAAHSVAYSDSASGVYVGGQLFKTLGIEAEMKAKARMIPAEPVAAVVARGEAEIGFQQISELLPIAGAEVVGPLPEDLQKYTVFSAAIASRSQAPGAARALIAFLASAEAAPIYRAMGLEPLAGR
jgi:molybdate transport system substrate-binding protein